MKPATPHAPAPSLEREHRVLLAEYGATQRRCSVWMAEQAEQIENLEAEVMRLRAAVIQRDTALALAREERAAFKARLRTRPDRVKQKANPAVATPRAMTALEASLAAADLVICQTGCLSHGAYWRVKNHCKRTGKTCVLVTEPEAMRIVRIHRNTLESAAARDRGQVASFTDEAWVYVTTNSGQV